MSANGRTHMARPLGAKPAKAGEPQGPYCWGALRAAYVREGRPPKWLRAGRVCTRCGAWLPDPELVAKAEAARKR